MKEDTARSIFIAYLEHLGKAPLPRRRNVPGPDVIIEGAAYECKGSKFDRNTLFKQIIFNAMQYSRTGIIIPYDALDCLFIHQLKALEQLLKRSIEIYVVVEEERIYSICRWSSISSLSSDIDRVAYEHIPEYEKHTPEEKVPRILEFLKDFNSKVREYIKKVVIEKAKNPSSPYEGLSYVLLEPL
jgi:hypothetical protein